jgi:hypothetical protein
MIPGPEPIEVLAPRLETVHLDVDGVGELVQGDGGSGRHDARHGLVGGDLPIHLDRRVRHPAAELEGTRSQSGPQRDPVGARIAGRHAEREGVGARGTGGANHARGELRETERGGNAGGELEEPASVHVREGVWERTTGGHHETSCVGATPEG